MLLDRKTIQDVYIRVCKDSGFGLDMFMAAKIAADTLNISSLEIGFAFGMDTLEKIAKGEHPVCKK